MHRFLNKRFDETGGLQSVFNGFFLTMIAMSLSGCFMGESYMSDNPVTARNYHERHPIIVGKSTINLDLFPVGGHLDTLSVNKIKDFSDRYRQYGESAIAILVPAGDAMLAKIVPEIRRKLRVEGVRGDVNIVSYAVTNHELASPIRLTFEGLKARVADRCGQWPTDLASANSVEGWKNEDYPNYGCATQAAFAAQIDDPRDLVQARGSTPPDVMMRVHAIETVRNSTGG